MTPGLTHEQCRREMCAACGGRAGTRRLTPALGERLRKWAQPAWSPDVTSYPTGVCETCLRLLRFCENEKSNDLLDRPGAKQRWIDFKLENVKVCRRKLASNCTCPICQARKSNFVGRQGYNNYNQERKQIMPSEDETVEKEEPKKDMMCCKCLQVRTGRGIPHICTEASRNRNLADLVLESKRSEQITAKIVKEVVDKKSEENGNNQPIRLKQLSGGNHLSITVGKKKEKTNGEVDVVVVAQLKKQQELSSKDTEKALRILWKGSIKVEKNVMNVIHEIGSTLEDHYDDVKMNFEVNKEKEEGIEEQPRKTKENKKNTIFFLRI